MKNLRRYFVIVLSILVLLSTATAACATSIDTSSPTIAPSDAQNILTEFQNEISYVESKYAITIDTLDAVALNLLKDEAVCNLQNSSYRFGPLMDAIALASAQSSMNSIPNSYIPIKKNEVISVYRSYNTLKGKYLADAAVGTTTAITGSLNISVTSGEFLWGAKIGASFSLGVSYSLNGPSDGTKLYNDVPATHRVAMGVLYGTIMKMECDWYLETGEVLHEISYYVDSGTANTTCYTLLASLGIPTYAQPSGSIGGVLYFSNQNTFRSQIESNPSPLI